MRLLVSGASATMSRLAQDAAVRPYLGHLVLPRNRNRPESLLATRLPFACDNGCFKGLDEPAFLRMVRTFVPFGPSWVAVPDVVADCFGTVRLFDYWYRLLEDGSGETPWALVAQDGMEDLDWDWWLGHASCLFVGGSTRWKLSRAAFSLVQEAKQRGKLTHMGRVNSVKRLTLAFEWGIDSVDGGSLSMFPDTWIPHFVTVLRALERRAVSQTLLPFHSGESER
jgi:hypothetical protein